MNTFFLCNFQNFSGYKLFLRHNFLLFDKRRLGKQRVEAMQILHLVQDYEFFESLSIQKQGVERELGSTQGAQDGMAYSQWKKINNQKIFFDKELKKYIFTPISDLEQPDRIKYREILSGFANHPAVLMWKGYQGALKLYINYCIKEWIKRGCKNNMCIYPMSQNTKVKVPKWLTQNSYLSQSHQIAMLRKEIARNEPEWYVALWHTKQMKCEPKFLDMGYFWPLTSQCKSVFSDFQDDYHTIQKCMDSDKLFLYETMITYAYEPNDDLFLH